MRKGREGTVQRFNGFYLPYMYKAANNGRTSDMCPAKMTKCPPNADSGRTKDGAVWLSKRS